MKFPITQEGLDSWFGESSDWRIDMGDYLAKTYSIEDFTVLDNYDDYIVDKYIASDGYHYTKYAEMNPNYIYLISKEITHKKQTKEMTHKKQSMYIPLDKKYEIKLFRGSPDVRGMYLTLPHLKGKKMGWDNVHLNLNLWRISGIFKVGFENNFMNWTTNPLNS